MNQLVNSSGAPCVSITGAAKMLGISRQAVSQLVARGRLPAEYIDIAGGAGVGMIPVTAVHAWRRRKKKQLTGRKPTA